MYEHGSFDAAPDSAAWVYTAGRYWAGGASLAAAAWARCASGINRNSIPHSDHRNCWIMCWYQLLTFSVQLLRISAGINCWDYLLRTSVEIICWDLLLRLSADFSRSTDISSKRSSKQSIKNHAHSIGKTNRSTKTYKQQLPINKNTRIALKTTKTQKKHAYSNQCGLAAKATTTKPRV